MSHSQLKDIIKLYEDYVVEGIVYTLVHITKYKYLLSNSASHIEFTPEAFKSGLLDESIKLGIHHQKQVFILTEKEERNVSEARAYIEALDKGLSEGLKSTDDAWLESLALELVKMGFKYKAPGTIRNLRTAVVSNFNYNYEAWAVSSRRGAYPKPAQLFNEDLMREAIEKEYLTKEHKSVKAAYDYYVRIFGHTIPAGQMKAVAYNTFKKFLDVNVSREEKIKKRHGSKSLQQAKVGKVGVWKELRPMEEVQIDTVHVTLPLADDCEDPLQEPNYKGIKTKVRVYSAVDAQTGKVIATHKSFGAENQYDVANIIRQVLRVATPEAIRVDNGSGYIANSIFDWGLSLGIEIEQCSRAAGYQKPHVESKFNAIRDLLANIPGYRGRNRDDDQKEDRSLQYDARFTMRSFIDWLDDKIHRLNTEKNPGDKGLTPDELWNHYTKQDDIRFVTEDNFSAAELRCIKTTKMLSRDGFQLNNIKYATDMEFFFELTPNDQITSVEVIVKYDPLDCRFVDVYATHPETEEQWHFVSGSRRFKYHPEPLSFFDAIAMQVQKARTPRLDIDDIPDKPLIKPQRQKPGKDVPLIGVDEDFNADGLFEHQDIEPPAKKIKQDVPQPEQVNAQESKRKQRKYKTR